MKMKLMSCMMILTLLAALMAGCSGKDGKLEQISAEEAKAYALTAAGLSANDVEMKKPEKASHNGMDYYRVSFTGKDGSYRYDVDALTGVVIDSETPQSIPQSGTGNGSPDGGNQPEALTAAEAKVKALAHAGKRDDEVTFVQVELDEDDGKIHYDIEFYSGNVEYDYEIDLYTGDVLEYDKDAENYKPESSPGSGGQQAGSGGGNDSSQATMLTREQAKAKALAHAGKKAEEVTFVQVELDADDGRKYYDVEFYSGKVEYDYEIDAYSGAVLEHDRDAENYKPPVSGGSQTITAEQAKALALGQVKGATLEHFREFDVDYDDGRLEYEGKIVYNGMEYEFEIDGYSGAIRSWDVERVDRDD